MTFILHRQSIRITLFIFQGNIYLFVTFNLSFSTMCLISKHKGINSITRTEIMFLVKGVILFKLYSHLQCFQPSLQL